MGIIQDWWLTVYNDWMGGNDFAMLMFGWEIFCAPFFIVLAMVGYVVESVMGER